MITSTDLHYFKKAAEVAEMSDYKKTKLGCVAVYHKSILAVGWNSNQSHSLQGKYDKYRGICDAENYQTKVHAEIACLSKIRYYDIDFSKVKIYIYRITKDRPHGLARPCRSCMRFIQDLGIKDVYYTTDIGYVNEKIER